MINRQPLLSREVKDRRPFFGIASLWSGVLAIIILMISFGYAFYMLSIGNDERIVFVIANILVIVNGLSIFAGFVFGVIDLFQKHHKKTLATIGLVLSGIAGLIYGLTLNWLLG